MLLTQSQLVAAYKRGGLRSVDGTRPGGVAAIPEKCPIPKQRTVRVPWFDGHIC